MLLVLQGMDTSGKGGVLRHAVGAGRPAGRAHQVVQGADPGRAAPRLPVAGRAGGCRAPGIIGVFDRSHYEDVLIARVRELVEPRGDRPPLRRDQRVREAAGRRGHRGRQVHAAHLRRGAEARLLARLDDPTKLWKFNPGDVDERRLWAAYREAYEIALERTNTEHAPWLVVPERPQVVRQAGRRPDAARDAAGDGPGLAAARTTTSRAEQPAAPRGAAG